MEQKRCGCEETPIMINNEEVTLLLLTVYHHVNNESVSEVPLYLMPCPEHEERAGVFAKYNKVIDPLTMIPVTRHEIMDHVLHPTVITKKLRPVVPLLKLVK